MGTLFRQTPNNGYPFPPKWPLKMGTGLEASAAHPRPNNIWVPPPPPGIGWEQICQWKTLTKCLMKCPPGRVSFGGLKSLARIFFSIACTKIKWFCPNITRLFARKWLFQQQQQIYIRGGGGGGLCSPFPMARTPTCPYSYAYYVRTPMYIWYALYTVSCFVLVKARYKLFFKWRYWYLHVHVAYKINGQWTKIRNIDIFF